MMTKTYIRPCPVRLIGEDLRKANLGELEVMYPCAIAYDPPASVWLIRCSCGVEFKADSNKLLSLEVASCGQCNEDEVQSEVPYIIMPDCYKHNSFV